MARPSWLRSLLAPKYKTPLRKKPAARQWAIEELESRLVPAVTAAISANVLTVTLGAATDAAFITNSASGITVGTTSGASNVTISGTGSIAAIVVAGTTSQSVNFDGSTAYALTGASGANGISVTGVAAVNFTDPITASGGNIAVSGATAINISAASITASGSESFANPVALSASAILSAGGTGVTMAAVTLGANLLTISGAGTANSIAGIVSGTGGLTMAGTGALTISGANTYTGATTVSSGTLTITGIASGGNNANAGAGANSQLATSSLNVGSGALAIINTASNFSSANNGTTLTGAGTIRLSSGKWYLGNPGGGTAISMSAGGVIDVLSGATLTNDYSNSSWSGNLGSVNVNTGATFDLRNNNVTVSALTGGGSVFDNGFTNTLTVGVGNGSGAFNGTIGVGGVTVALTKIGTGIQTLGGANTYTGATTVNGGVLKAGVASVANTSGPFGNNSAVTIANVAGAGIDITGFNTQIGSLTGGGTTGGNVTLGAAILSVGGDNTNPAAYAGVISGTGTINKIGTGAQILSGLNTYSGGTTISAGTLKAGSATAFGVSTAAVTIVSGAVLDLNGTSVTNTNPLTLNGTGIGNNGALINSSATAGTYTGLLTLGSPSSIVAGSGSVVISNAGTITGAGFGLTLGGTATGTLVSILGTGAGTLTKIGAGTWTLTGANTYTGLTSVSAGTLDATAVVALPGYATAHAIALANGASLDVSVGGSGQFTSANLDTLRSNVDFNAASTLVLDTTGAGGTFTYASSIGNATAVSGTLGIGKAGTGTLFLTGVNTYSGGTTVLAGTLDVPKVAALPVTTTATAITLAAGTTLDLNVGGTGEFASADLAALLSNAVFNATSTLVLDTTNAGGSFTYLGAINNTLALTKVGPGILVLGGNSTYSGATTISAGSISLLGVGSNVLPSGTTTNFAAGTTLNVGSVSQSLADTIFSASGTNAITGSGGTLAVTGGTAVAVGDIGTTTTLNLSGATVSIAPTLYIGHSPVNSNTFQSVGTVTVATGTTLNASTIDLGWSSYTAGSFAPSSVGTLTINGGAVKATTLTLVDLTTSGHGFSVGTGTVNLNTGATLFAQTIQPGASQAGSITRAFNFNGGTIENLNPTANLTIAAFTAGPGGAGTSTFAFVLGSGTPTFDITDDRTGTVLQPLSGSGSLTKTDAGTLILGAVNTYTGGTTVNGGALTVSGAGSIATSTGLSVAGGAQFNYFPTTVGTMTLGAGSILNLAAGSTLGLAFGDQVQVLGAATSSGTASDPVYLNLSGTLTSGTPYTVLTATSGLSGGTYVVSGPTNYTYTITQTGTAVVVTPTTAIALSAEYWMGGLPGSPATWATSNGTASNWVTSTGTATPLIPGPTATVFFSAAGASSQGSMILGANMSVAGISINDFNPLVLNDDGVSVLTVGTGGIDVNTPGGNLTETLAAPLALSGPQTWFNAQNNVLDVTGPVANGGNLLTVQGSGDTTIGGVPSAAPAAWPRSAPAL